MATTINIDRVQVLQQICNVTNIIKKRLYRYSYANNISQFKEVVNQPNSIMKYWNPFLADKNFFHLVNQ